MSSDDEYGAVAPVYDAATAWALDPLRRELARAAASGLDGPVLDVCCGTGRQCLYLARAGRMAVGVDISAGMLARARPLTPACGGRIHVARGDARRLPFPDASFQASCISLALHEKPAAMRHEILDEMLRVTVPGGHIGVVDYLSPQTRLQAALAWGVKGVERLAGREHHALYAQYMREGGLEGLLSRQRLTPAELRRRVFGLIGIALVRRPG
jgi:ubiquinone/menaquinone biosynthesis C-methylase UbiE